ncbi:MAG: DNA polymerase III subunit gamma/tau [Candidatus Saccharimonadales bacterium]
MGQVLYRKYRPQNLDQVVGQEHITAALDRAVKSGRLSHAYLFSGPRGVGKTSAARILAYAANDVSYGNNSVAMDIIEIDAASNTSVEAVRDLRDKIYVAPTRAKYKIYIIDEVHMLSKAAFNALLKTLEEPPAHVIFILATTEVHKLPATIISRTQRFHFRPIETNTIIEHLKAIASADKIAIDDAALAIIAAHGQGSFRDSISLLDQARSLKSQGKISAADVLDLLGQASDKSLAAIESALIKRDASQIIAQTSAAQNQGIDAALLAKQLAARWRKSLLGGQPVLPTSEILQLLASLINVQASKEPYALLEIILLETVLTNASSGASETLKPGNAKAPKNEPQAAGEPKAKPKAAKIKPPKITDELAPKTAQSSFAAGDSELWPEILNMIKQNYSTLYSTARMAHAELANDKLILKFRFPFHQKVISRPANLQIFVAAAQALTGQSIAIECWLDASLPSAQEPATSPAPAQELLSNLDNITSIFGGGELLES